MDKKLLKSGDIIFENNVDEALLVVDFKGELIAVGKNVWHPIDSSLNEVTSAFRPKNNHAVANIFGDAKLNYYEESAHSIWGSDYEPLYDSKEKIVELTLEEIAQQLDIDVKQLRIKE